MTQDHKAALPELPDPDCRGVYTDGYTSSQMEEYARQAIALATPPAPAEPQDIDHAGMVARGTKAWAGVPADFVESLRNGPASPGVYIPMELASRIADALGRFVSDEGWGQADMDTGDDLDALLSAPSAAPSPASEQSVYDAIDILTAEADSLRECHTKGDDDWTGEPEAKAEYDRMLRTVTGLRGLPASEQDAKDGANE